MKAPPLGFTTKAVLKRIKDGDTFVVEIRRELTIRLLDCWAPEVHGDEKPLGIAARDYLASLVAPGDELVIRIRGNEEGDLAELMTLGRVLADAWRPDDGYSLSEQMVAAGHATKERAKP
jgi:endonuclease YncB( thermonuclease family)